jgi:gliding motility associated protien GldN
MAFRIFFAAYFISLSVSAQQQGQAKLFQVPKAGDKELAPMENNDIIRYETVADRSILWSKVVWERADLNRPENMELYFPLDTIKTEKRSLYYTLLKALKERKVKAYSDSYFEEARTYEDLLPAIQKRDTTSAGFERLNQGFELTRDYISERKVSAYDIKEYRIKGVWYFDKRRSELRYRILGIAPVAVDVNFLDEVADSETIDDSYLVELFWLWYPEVRPLLASTPSFNVDNTNFPVSFDRLLNTRTFAAQIYQTDNAFDNIEELQRELQFPDFSSGTDEEEQRLADRKKFFDFLKRDAQKQRKAERETQVNLNPKRSN